MTTSKPGIALIKKHEGFRSHPYLCPAGIPTIGYGSTFYLNGTKVKMTDKPINESEAGYLLIMLLGRFEKIVNTFTDVHLNQNEFDALVSFVYNVGAEAFKKSTLLRLLNAGVPKVEVANQFHRWNKGGGKVLQGLVTRRKDEADLFLA